MAVKKPVRYDFQSYTQYATRPLAVLIFQKITTSSLKHKILSHSNIPYLSNKLIKMTFCYKLLLFALSIFHFNNSIFSQEKEYQITTQKVNGTVHMLTGKGGNIAICSGDEGVFMVDAQFADMTDKIQKAVGDISKGPINYLVNTHWHGDHTGGNKYFSEQGAKIIAHQNVRKRLSTEQHMKAFNRTVPAADEAAWPDITFNDENTLYINEEDIFVFHVDNAHTDGDAMVYFTSSNVLHMGDTYFQGKFPFIDLSSGGSIKGLLEAVEQALFICDDDTKIIPGHGKLSNKKELKEYQTVLTNVLKRVEKAVNMKMAIEEIQAAGFTKEYDDTFGTGFISSEKFIDTIWTDLTREK